MAEVEPFQDQSGGPLGHDQPVQRPPNLGAEEAPEVGHRLPVAPTVAGSFA